MKNLTLIFVILTCFILFSCGSTPAKESEKVLPPTVEEAALPEEKSDDIQDDDTVEFIDEVVEINDVHDEEDEEYIRSTTELKDDELVSKQEFLDDKTEILRIIEELKEIMAKEDTEAWLTYISPDSIRYYSSPANIRKAQKKLPNKTIQLNGIGDYFKHVFIPSRRRSNVDEIRYISKSNIKAVEVKPDGSTVVYYQFVKVNGKWLVHIPTL